MSTLYRKYRPSTFGEIVGQEYILQTLTNSIKNSQVSHAYLFTGPRGTGKTTTARIFAKTVNCLKPVTKTGKGNIKIEPCNKCKNCKMISENKAIDLIEIDAASHTGVDNIRQLKEAINIPPTNFKYKVYIIDEVHMLSTGAFNALLKTLEEPPAHAIFILATTELHKVPATIISRCQQFNIKPLTKKEIAQRLEQIADKEKIRVDKTSLNLIATEAGGGMRDAESLFGQIISMGNKKISSSNIEKLLGISSKKNLLELITAIAQGKISTVINIINDFQNNGLNIKSFNKQLLNYFRNLMLIKIAQDLDKKILNNLSDNELSALRKNAVNFELIELTIIIALLQNSLTKSNQSDIPQLPLEMAMVEYFLKTNKITSPLKKTEGSETINLKKKSPLKQVSPQKNNSIINSTVAATTNISNRHINITTTENASSAKDKTIISDTDGIVSNSVKLSINDFLDKWAEVLEGVKEKSLSIAGVLKNCAPIAIEENFILIKANHTFGKNQLNNPQNKLTIEKVFVSIFKVALKVKFLTEDELPKDINMKINSNDLTDSASENKNSLDEEMSNNTDDNELLYKAMKKIGGKIITE